MALAASWGAIVRATVIDCKARRAKRHACAEKAAVCAAVLKKPLIKCNADPACLPPNDVTVVIAVLDVDDKFE
jgi:hypothetical protein